MTIVVDLGRKATNKNIDQGQHCLSWPSCRVQSRLILKVELVNNITLIRLTIYRMVSGFSLVDCKGIISFVCSLIPNSVTFTEAQVSVYVLSTSVPFFVSLVHRSNPKSEQTGVHIDQS